MARIKTKILILSDTHGLKFEAGNQPLEPLDLVIHCGDLTNDSSLEEYRGVIRLFQQLDAPLKVVIAGNHDFTLDDLAYKQKFEEACRLAGEDLSILFNFKYGQYGEAKQLLLEAREQGILFLEPGTHRLQLGNGACLNIHANPYTPVSEDSSGWGFQYTGAHEFDIEKGTDIAITHGPPLGIMDMTSQRKRIGCPQLFAAIAKAQPRVHCFGHVHKSWGARLVSWRPKISDTPHHFSDIDNERSFVIENLAKLKDSKFDSPKERDMEAGNKERYEFQRYCHANPDRPIHAGETMFINAALMTSGRLSHLPWTVDLDLDQYENRVDE